MPEEATFEDVGNEAAEDAKGSRGNGDAAEGETATGEATEDAEETYGGGEATPSDEADFDVIESKTFELAA